MSNIIATTHWMQKNGYWFEAPIGGRSFCMDGICRFFDLPCSAIAIRFLVVRRATANSVKLRAWACPCGCDFVTVCDLWLRSGWSRHLRRAFDNRVPKQVHVECEYREKS